jgi:hypothetical protein
MSRAVAPTSISFATVVFATVVLLFPSGAAAAAWTCQAESASGTGSGGGPSRKEAEDRALGYCAAKSARFSVCRIVTCHREHRS